MNETIKKGIKEEIKYLVWIFSDKEFQERVWARGEGPECDSFGESVCDTDLIDNVVEKYQDYDITKEQKNLLKELVQKIENYDEPETDAELVKDPKWHEVREFAKYVYERLW